MTTGSSTRTSTDWLTEDDCRLADFTAIVEQTTSLADYPQAEAIERGVLIYGPGLSDRAEAGPERRAVQAELIRALSIGPGVVVLKQAFSETVVDQATETFTAMIADQKSAGTGGGDHFAAPGANDRIWAALDKFAHRDPTGFAQYYANPPLALISQAWLGPNYQVTSQVNVVNPGGLAQVAHRDYHLGFMSAQQSVSYPAHVHRLSPTLTLQGAVAHCDMPVLTGPTSYLPYSQQYELGYLAFHRPEFTAYFNRNHVQLPLAKGDAVFFNPALFHCAGTNHSSDVRRMANLLQISSAFGRAMETVDRTAICAALYPVLRGWTTSTSRDRAELDNVIAAAAEGYAFPTNLDADQPVDGLAPQTQAELVRLALTENWDTTVFVEALLAGQRRRHAEHH